MGDDGYIRDPIETISVAFAGGPDAAQDIQDAIPVLQQRLEPVGICARNLQECLLLEIDAWEAATKSDDLTVPRALVTSVSAWIWR